MKDWVNISQRLIMLGQLGLSLVMPVLIPVTFLLQELGSDFGSIFRA